MAKHMEQMEEACANLWKLLDGVNKGFKNEAKDAEQYHEIIASLYKLKGLEMAAQYEEEQGGGSSRRGGSYEGGYSGMYFDPMIHGASMRGGSYDGRGGNSYGQGGNSYNQGGGSYNGGYSGNSYGGGSYEGGASGRYQPRNEMGQFKADGRSNRGGSYGASYHSQDEMIQDMRDRMQDADPETARCYRKVIRDMQGM